MAMLPSRVSMHMLQHTSVATVFGTAAKSADADDGRIGVVGIGDEPAAQHREIHRIGEFDSGFDFAHTEILPQRIEVRKLPNKIGCRLAPVLFF